MGVLRNTLLAGFLISNVSRAISETSQVETGGDTFVAARTVVANGQKNGDLHAAGYDVAVNADAAQDLHAVGLSLLAQSRIAHDMTVPGFSIRTGQGAATDGNVRFFIAFTVIGFRIFFADPSKTSDRLIIL